MAGVETCQGERAAAAKLRRVVLQSGCEAVPAEEPKSNHYNHYYICPLVFSGVHITKTDTEFMLIEMFGLNIIYYNILLMWADLYLLHVCGCANFSVEG